MKNLFKLSTLLLCICMLLSLAACGDKTEESDSSSVVYPKIWSAATYKEDTTVGEGSKTVNVTVEADGYKIKLTVKTDATTLGDALQALDLIAGDEGEFGLYIKTVNGMLADYDVDQTYWGFYQNGEYMMTGVDGTEISGGESYELIRTQS